MSTALSYDRTCYSLLACVRTVYLTKSPLPLNRAQMYTDVDGQCDKLVTDDRRQFITLTVHLNSQNLKRST